MYDDVGQLDMEEIIPYQRTRCSRARMLGSVALPIVLSIPVVFFFSDPFLLSVSDVDVSHPFTISDPPQTPESPFTISDPPQRPESPCRVHGICEFRFSASLADPFEVVFGAVFRCENVSHTQASRCTKEYIIRGFHDGDNEFVVRFSPPVDGNWSYSTTSEATVLKDLTGSFSVTKPHADERGPVTAINGSFRFSDGSTYFPVTTTAYAWLHQNDSMCEATLRTLAGVGSAFNKIRFTIFPKWYVYNREEPRSNLYPYEGQPPRQWNFQEFNPIFWRRIEKYISRLREQQIVADIILFHPYDYGHWGFDCMGGRDPNKYNISNDAHYLRYTVARLSAFSNVWWSMANEWDLVDCKSKGLPRDALWESGTQSYNANVWDSLFHILQKEDPYGRETSIHNGKVLYDHSRPWIGHVSLQGLSELTPVLQERYNGRPVIWDEVWYEGDIPEVWGTLTGPGQADRFWWGSSFGAYGGHSETIMLPGVSNEHQVMWWSKGGDLRGSSPTRILWYKKYMESTFYLPRERLEYVDLRASSGCEARGLVARGRVAVVHIRSKGNCKLSLPGLRPNQRFQVKKINWWALQPPTTIVASASGSVVVAVGEYGFRLPCNLEISPLP